MDRYFIGIDPGIGGAVSIICLDTIKNNIKSVSYYKYQEVINNLEKFTKELHSYEYKVVVLEQVHSLPSDSRVSAFTFGQNVGWWKGYLTQFELISFKEVDPKTWHSVVLDFMFTPYRRDENKKRTVAFINRVMKDYLDTPFEIKSYNYDIADSMCLALFGIWSSN